MAYFAKIEDGIVTNVIVADQAFIDAGHVEGTWLKTTFGAVGGVVYKEPIVGQTELISTDKPCIRKNYASIGYTYDAVRDAFIAPKPDGNWVLNENTCLWEASN
jgi:hypothetical protein